MMESSRTMTKLGLKLKTLMTRRSGALVRIIAALCVLNVASAIKAIAQPITLQCDSAQTTAKFTLGATLHSVHGAFRVKRCEVHFDPATGKLDGEIVFDATSGQSGNDSRDRKMHKEVLESARYPEITFRPDRILGTLGTTGVSSLQVHGTFGIHGANHDLTVPLEVKLEAERWSASGHFAVPYAKWGMKDPSSLFLKVADSVDIEFQGTGVVKPAAQ
jgi:polyisoprenoid-binding protein YceI